MSNTSESDEAPGDPQKPAKPLRPKRGAFPAPTSGIEKAKPYIPDAGEGDDPEGKPGLPGDAGGEEEG